LTASFSNTPLSSFPFLLPSTMSYLDISNTPISDLTYPLPHSLSFLNLESASFSMGTLETVTGQLVTNGALSGTLNIQSYGLPGTFSTTLTTNIGLLQSNNWTVLVD
jgi:hypothetical protein